MKSYKAPTNTITGAGSNWGETARDQMHVTRGTLLDLPPSSTVRKVCGAVLACERNLLFSFSPHDTPHGHSRAGHWLWAPQRSHGLWSLEANEKSPEFTKVKTCCLCHRHPSLGSSRWVQRYCSETCPYPCIFKMHARTCCAW